jgi:hypothetical protein
LPLSHKGASTLARFTTIDYKRSNGHRLTRHSVPSTDRSGCKGHAWKAAKPLRRCRALAQDPEHPLFSGIGVTLEALGVGVACVAAEAEGVAGRKSSAPNKQLLSRRRPTPPPGRNLLHQV